jgi:hypothetical protein
VDLLIAIITLALLAAAIAVISGPLRAERARTREARAGRAARTGDRASASRSELEAAREAKYREIRDAELDYRTGKLSDADYGAIDSELRAEALAILDRLEDLDAGGADGGAEPPGTERRDPGGKR